MFVSVCACSICSSYCDTTSKLFPVMEEKACVNLFSFIFTTDVENRIHAFIRDQKEGKQNFLSAVLSVKCC